MSKWTDFRDWVDDQEERVDDWLKRPTGSPHTARMAFAIALVLLLGGLLLWLN